MERERERGCLWQKGGLKNNEKEERKRKEMEKKKQIQIRTKEIMR